MRIDVTEVDFGGYDGGGIPPFWPPSQAIPAFLHSLQVYAGTGGPSVVDGTGLTPLLGGNSGGTGGGTTTTTTTRSVGDHDHGSVGHLDDDVTDHRHSATDRRPRQRLPHGDVGRPGVRLRGRDHLWSRRRTHLSKPVVGIAPAPDGGGYWLVGADGGIFNFGDARFYGSTGGIGLNAPIVGMAATPDGGGYWLVGADGGIFASGDAPYSARPGRWSSTSRWSG